MIDQPAWNTEHSLAQSVIYKCSLETYWRVGARVVGADVGGACECVRVPYDQIVG
jgi:hypothetical protein